MNGTLNGENRPQVTDVSVEFEKSPVQTQDFSEITDPIR